MQDECSQKKRDRNERQTEREEEFPFIHLCRPTHELIAEFTSGGAEQTHREQDRPGKKKQMAQNMIAELARRDCKQIFTAAVDLHVCESPEPDRSRVKEDACQECG